MYYNKKNIYICEENKILFDLDTLNIYKMDNDAFKRFEKLYLTTIQKENPPLL